MADAELEFHVIRASAWPSDPAEQAAFLDDLDHSDWNALTPQVAATIFFQEALATTSVFDTRFGPRVYWLRPLVHGEVAVAREAPAGVLFVDASLQALRSTIKATFHYAWSGRFLGTAYIPQSRKVLTALDLARIALGVVERLRVMEGSRQKLWLLLEGHDVRSSAVLWRNRNEAWTRWRLRVKTPLSARILQGRVAHALQGRPRRLP